jgi:hypothetical protein
MRAHLVMESIIDTLRVGIDVARAPLDDGSR